MSCSFVIDSTIRSGSPSSMSAVAVLVVGGVVPAAGALAERFGLLFAGTGAEVVAGAAGVVTAPVVVAPRCAVSMFPALN